MIRMIGDTSSINGEARIPNTFHQRVSLMSTITNIVVMAQENLYRDKARRMLRVPKGRRCGFRIYTTTKMGEVMTKVANLLWHIPVVALTFTFAGESVEPNSDFETLNMRELDIIDVTQAVSWCEIPSSTLSTDLKKALNFRDGTNFTVKVGKRSSTSTNTEVKGLDLIDDDSGVCNEDYKEFYLHTFLLRSRSEKFAGLFDSKMQESVQGVLELPNVHPKTFELLVEYLYTDDITIPDEQALPLLALADEYVVPRLKKKCEIFLINSLKIDNVLDIYAFANLYNAESLKVACNQFFIDNFCAISQIPNFKNKVNKEQLLEVVQVKASKKKKNQ